MVYHWLFKVDVTSLINLLINFSGFFLVNSIRYPTQIIMLSANMILLLPYQVWKPFIYCLVIYRIYKIFSKIFIFIKIFNWFLGVPMLENLCLILPVILNCCCALKSSGGFKNILVPKHSLSYCFLSSHIFILFGFIVFMGKD